MKSNTERLTYINTLKKHTNRKELKRLLTLYDLTGEMTTYPEPEENQLLKELNFTLLPNPYDNIKGTVPEWHPGFKKPTTSQLNDILYRVDNKDNQNNPESKEHNEKNTNT